MSFCRALSTPLIRFVGQYYADTLSALIVLDTVGGEAALRYCPSALSVDAEPDPLVLLCWKCRELRELVIVGYELAEINLLAIGKLRGEQLRRLVVPLECVLDVRYTDTIRKRQHHHHQHQHQPPLVHQRPPRRRQRRRGPGDARRRHLVVAEDYDNDDATDVVIEYGTCSEQIIDKVYSPIISLSTL